MTARFIVMTSSAQVKGKAKLGRYRNVAVVETDGQEPQRIDERDRHVVRIVRHYGTCSEGKTDRCQYRQALASAYALATELNAREDETCESS